MHLFWDKKFISVSTIFQELFDRLLNPGRKEIVVVDHKYSSNCRHCVQIFQSDLDGFIEVKIDVRERNLGWKSGVLFLD